MTQKERIERLERAVLRLATLLVEAQTGFGQRHYEDVRVILTGEPHLTSERPPTGTTYVTGHTPIRSGEARPHQVTEEP